MEVKQLLRTITVKALDLKKEIDIQYRNIEISYILTSIIYYEKQRKTLGIRKKLERLRIELKEEKEKMST